MGGHRGECVGGEGEGRQEGSRGCLSTVNDSNLFIQSTERKDRHILPLRWSLMEGGGGGGGGGARYSPSPQVAVKLSHPLLPSSPLPSSHFPSEAHKPDTARIYIYVYLHRPPSLA